MFTRAFSCEQIAEFFLPMAFRFLSPGAACAVRPAAAEGLALFLRCGLRERPRAETFLRLVRDFARGKAFTQRIAFVLVAQQVCVGMGDRWGRGGQDVAVRCG